MCELDAFYYDWVELVAVVTVCWHYTLHLLWCGYCVRYSGKIHLNCTESQPFTITVRFWHNPLFLKTEAFVCTVSPFRSHLKRVILPSLTVLSICCLWTCTTETRSVWSVPGSPKCFDAAKHLRAMCCSKCWTIPWRVLGSFHLQSSKQPISALLCIVIHKLVALFKCDSIMKLYTVQWCDDYVNFNM